jgi:hypothetical protein
MVLGFELKDSLLQDRCSYLLGHFVLGIFEIGSHSPSSPLLASNLNLPDLCLLSSQDYRCESPVPASYFCFILFIYFLAGLELRALCLLGRCSTS